MITPQYTHGEWRLTFNESKDIWEGLGPQGEHKHSKSLKSLRTAIDQSEVETKAFKRFDAFVVRSYMAGHVRVTITSKGDDGRMRCTYPDGRRQTESPSILFEVSPENADLLDQMRVLEKEIEALNARKINARAKLKLCKCY